MKVMKKGFTLAEVLITLAIIGVVAALTVPTVVTNYKNKALETQKKKAMTVLANGFRLLMAEDDVTELKNTKIENCENEKACLATEIKRIFNVISDNNAENEFFGTKYQFASEPKAVWDDTSLKYVFIAADGTIYGIAQNKDAIDVMVDLNGVKNPNKGAEDLCKFVVTNKGAVEDHCADMADWERTPAASPELHCHEVCNKIECWLECDE